MTTLQEKCKPMVLFQKHLEIQNTRKLFNGGT
jgi:hypothetical protein